MDKELREMQKILEELASDVESLSRQERMNERAERKVEKRLERTERLESLIRSECADIKRMIGEIDSQSIADSVSKMVANQLLSPLQQAIENAVKEPARTNHIGRIAEDMKKKVEKLSDRHIRVIRCLSQAKGEWIDYGSLAGVCGISKSCMRGYISDLKRVYEIPIESSIKGGRALVRIDPQTTKKLALGYQAVKVEAA